MQWKSPNSDLANIADYWSRGLEKKIDAIFEVILMSLIRLLDKAVERCSINLSCGIIEKCEQISKGFLSHFEGLKPVRNVN